MGENLGSATKLKRKARSKKPAEFALIVAVAVQLVNEAGAS